jgi:tetratricopeptide (TPR) repeat protein
MVASSPNKRRPHQNYGQALSTAGRLNEALSEFKKVLALDDDGSVPPRDSYREIGVVYFRLGLFDEAILAWQKGLQYAPYDAGLLNNLAIALMKQKRLDEAIVHAETAARSNASMPEPFNTLGEIYLTRGQSRKAAESFKKYLYLRPEDSRGYWNAALALREAGDLEAALQYATQFLARERDPRFRQTALQLVEHLKSRLDATRR